MWPPRSKEACDMQFVYKPTGAPEQRWDFNPDKLMSPEAEAIERLTGTTFGKWVEDIKAGSMLALRAYLWVMLKRKEPTLKADQVQFSFSEVDLEPSRDELETAREELQAKVDAGAAAADEVELLAGVVERLASMPDAPTPTVDEHEAAPEGDPKA